MLNEDNGGAFSTEELTAILKLTKDLKSASRVLGEHEARFLVDCYYQMQRDRIRSAHQERTLAEGSEPNEVLSWLLGQRETLENQVRRALDAYSASKITGIWARSICGIGPVIAAGLLSNIDITKAPTVGHIWRFAGLDPTVKWEKGQKRPWNNSLKRLCFLIGESFVKVSNNDKDVYGQIYKARKAIETAKNEAGEYADQAKASLEAKNFGRDTEARKQYEAGRLPLARIHLRSKRYAVKLFLSALHEVMFWDQFKELPPKPYALAHLDHVHYIGVPNAHLVPGLAESRQQRPAKG
jgi:Transposase IS116/IS110/IS902 family